jgi:Ser/Thr protein kinase RdoA (MazF antagonist)
MSADGSLASAAAIAPEFAIDGMPTSVVPHAGGHIHDSFVVTTAARRWFLQRMNTRVFQEPERVVENIANVTAFLARTGPPGARALEIVPARNGGWLARDELGEAWRMFVFLEGTSTRATARSEADAEGAAYVFGRFQRRLAAYDGPQLHVTIPRFHDTARRFRAFDRAVQSDRHARAAGAAAQIQFAFSRRALAGTLAEAYARGDAPRRIAHHDAKIANILFDESGTTALCVVDLDTVMPGLSLYDFGDLVRSMVSPDAEDSRDPSRVRAEPERFAAIARGYLSGTDGLLASAERRLMPAAAETIVYEQGLRFLTDHLEGDAYYRITRPGQNLDRCRVQFALLASLGRQRAEFTRVVERS